MAVRRLVLDDFVEEEHFLLIAIHCNLEDYRLAYLLNSYLNVSLKKKSEDLTFTSGASYGVYEWNCIKGINTWNFVSNVFKKEEIATTQNTLFNSQVNTKSLFLVPEYKKVNYFLKIKDESKSVNEKKILMGIQKIPQIVTAYKVDTEQLISKENLIF